MSYKYRNLIFTDHVIKRMQERSLRTEDVWAAWYNPDNSRYAKSKGAWIYYKQINSQLLEVVAKKNVNRDWVILSVWLKKEIYKKASRNFITRFVDFLRKNTTP